MLNPKLEAMISPAIDALGLELWGCELIRHGKQTELWVYIEGPGGTAVTIDQCATASRQISAILDVEDPISSAYQLQVSSPGMDRVLFTPSQYQRYLQHKLKVQTRVLIEGQRNFTGTLQAVNDNEITMQYDQDKSVQLPFNQIDKARLIIDI